MVQAIHKCFNTSNDAGLFCLKTDYVYCLYESNL